MRNDLLADIVTASGGTITDRNNRNLLLKNWLEAVQAPAVNYVARLNGTGQYWQLSEEILLTGNFRVGIEVLTSSSSGKIMDSTSDENRFDITIFDYSIIDKFYMMVEVDGQQANALSQDVLHAVSIIRDDNTPNRQDRVLSRIGARFNNVDFLDGYVRNLRIYDENDVLVNEIPLTNKAQGATQLASVGSVNATMVGYNEDVWEQF
jgi:hypothetical protein